MPDQLEAPSRTVIESIHRTVQAAWLGFLQCAPRAGAKTAFPSTANAASLGPAIASVSFFLTVTTLLRAELSPLHGLLVEQKQATASAVAPGDHVRKLTVDGLERSCVIHVPPGLHPTEPAPLVLVLHGAAMNAQMMQGFSGMNAQADAAKFIAVYPNGTGLAGAFLTWNSGGLGPARKKPDDVSFLRALLDDLAGILQVDPRRTYAAGMSNGAMMCYRLAAEMPDRIAAIAAVGGTLAMNDPRPSRAVPLIHFHGTDDRVVPYAGPRNQNSSATSFRSVPETIATWVKLTSCWPSPLIREVPDRFPDSTTVRVSTYGPGRAGAEVVLVDIIGGGHTWPGQQPAVSLIGKSTREISANRMIWDFFQKHPLPAPEKGR